MARKSQFLTGRRIDPNPIASKTSIAELVDPDFLECCPVLVDDFLKYFLFLRCHDATPVVQLYQIFGNGKGEVPSGGFG